METISSFTSGAKAGTNQILSFDGFRCKSVYLEFFGFPVKEYVDHKIAVIKLACDERLCTRPDIRPEVENETREFSSTNEHGNVDSGAIRVRVVDVHNGDAVRDVLKAEGGA